MAAVTICSDFGAKKSKVWHCFHCLPIYFPWSLSKILKLLMVTLHYLTTKRGLGKRELNFPKSSFSSMFTIILSIHNFLILWNDDRFIFHCTYKLKFTNMSYCLFTLFILFCYIIIKVQNFKCLFLKVKYYEVCLFWLLCMC